MLPTNLSRCFLLENPTAAAAGGCRYIVLPRLAPFVPSLHFPAFPPAPEPRGLHLQTVYKTTAQATAWKRNVSVSSLQMPPYGHFASLVRVSSDCWLQWPV